MPTYLISEALCNIVLEKIKCKFISIPETSFLLTLIIISSSPYNILLEKNLVVPFKILCTVFLSNTPLNLNEKYPKYYILFFHKVPIHQQLQSLFNSLFGVEKKVFPITKVSKVESDSMLGPGEYIRTATHECNEINYF